MYNPYTGNALCRKPEWGFHQVYTKTPNVALSYLKSKAKWTWLVGYMPLSYSVGMNNGQALSTWVLPGPQAIQHVVTTFLAACSAVSIQIHTVGKGNAILSFLIIFFLNVDKQYSLNFKMYTKTMALDCHSPVSAFSLLIINFKQTQTKHCFQQSRNDFLSQQAHSNPYMCSQLQNDAHRSLEP